MTVITDLRSEVTPIFATQIDGEEEDTCSLPSISSRVSMTTKTSPRSAKSQSNKSRDQTPRSEQSRGKTQQTRVKTQQTRTQSKQSNFSRREDKNKRNNKNFIARFVHKILFFPFTLSPLTYVPLIYHLVMYFLKH